MVYDPLYIATRDSLIPTAEDYANKIHGVRNVAGNIGDMDYVQKWNATYLREMERLWQTDGKALYREAKLKRERKQAAEATKKAIEAAQAKPKRVKGNAASDVFRGKSGKPEA